MPDTKKPVVMFASIGDRDDILDNSSLAAIDILRDVLADAADFFEQYAQMTKSEQADIQAEKDRVIARMKHHVQFTE